MSWRIDLRGTLGALALDVRVDTGSKVVVLLGANGAGKTTVLRAVAGADLPVTGHVRVGERVLLDTGNKTCVPAHLRRVGYVPQGFGLFPHMTALENVAFGCADGKDSAAAYLAQLGAGGLAHRRPGALSGGEQQRVALARALAAAPSCLLLDEPMSALDIVARREMRASLASLLSETGLPALVVTHDVRDVRALGGSVVVLDAGSVLQMGTVGELAQAPASAFVEAFFGA